MISAAKTTRSPQGGFTMIEIILVLGIAAIMAAGGVGLMVASSDEKQLSRTSGEIELMAKQARTKAVLQQTPYAMEFSEGGIRVLPLAQAIDEGKKSPSSRKKKDAAKKDDSSGNSQMTLDDGMEVSIKRWRSDVVLTTAKNKVHLWRFDPDGLCEPISLRLSCGKSWSEDTYHPLTATISDSQLEAH